MSDSVEKTYLRPRETRLRSSQDFERIYSQRVRWGDDHLLIFAGRNELENTRIGLSVSKKHGNAVQRNRLKRLIREAFRLSQHDLPVGLDLILIPRQNSGGTLQEYRWSLTRGADKLARRLQPKE